MPSRPAPPPSLVFSFLWHVAGPLVAVSVVLVAAGRAFPAEPIGGETGIESGARAAGDADRGYRTLTQTPLLPGDFSEAVFDQTWQVWPEPLRSEAEAATPQRRRQMAMQRYGLTTRPGDDSGLPLQYVVSADGTWTMNCFACHGGSVYGTPTPGAPNNAIALPTLTEEIRATKWQSGVALGRMDLGSLFIPLGTTNGTTNAVVFGMGLMHFRDPQLNVLDRLPAKFTHHDMDAPPWWHFHKRPSLYIDGFAQKGHRGLMQFMLVPENGPQYFRDHEDEFRDVYAYLDSLRPPVYPGAVQTDLAAAGETLFGDHCARCHGTYGTDDPSYPNLMVPIDEVGTDPVRLRALSVQGRQKYADSWFAHAGEPDQQTTTVDPPGYVAPPLDGVWASPPYFHNGSVPTLWGVLNPDQRPTVWRRVATEIDPVRIGLTVESVEKIPVGIDDAAVRRGYFDTRREGKANTGHDFPDVLTRQEKLAVLEYLKTL